MCVCVYVCVRVCVCVCVCGVKSFRKCYHPIGLAGRVFSNGSRNRGLILG